MPMYRYVHNDGRTGQSPKGAWFAIKLALGETEASDVVTKSKSYTWRDQKAKLFVEDEQVGTFYKE
jgi:hypothetical protein